MTERTLEAPARSPVAHPDLVFFDAILYETEFLPAPKVPDAVNEGLNQVADSPMWESIVFVGRQLPEIRQALESASGWEQEAPARSRLLDAMVRFHDVCLFVPASLRPILFRYFWEGRKGDAPINWVPVALKHDMRTHMRAVFHPAFSACAWDNWIMTPHAFVCFDPRYCTKDELGDFRSECNKSVRQDRGAKGSFGLKREFIYTFMHSLGKGLLHTPGAYPPSLKTAWNQYVLGHGSPDGTLVALVADAYEKRHGKKIDPGYVKDMLLEVRKNPEGASGWVWLEPVPEI